MSSRIQMNIRISTKYVGRFSLYRRQRLRKMSYPLSNRHFITCSRLRGQSVHVWEFFNGGHSSIFKSIESAYRGDENKNSDDSKSPKMGDYWLAVPGLNLRKCDWGQLFLFVCEKPGKTPLPSPRTRMNPRKAPCAFSGLFLKTQKIPIFPSLLRPITPSRKPPLSTPPIWPKKDKHNYLWRNLFFRFLQCKKNLIYA